jgi:anti-sigma B factor antagonist
VLTAWDITIATHSTQIPDSASTTASNGFSMDTDWSARAAVLSVRGVVDMLTTPQLAKAIQEALADAAASLIVDLSEVELLASVGIGALVAAQQDVGTVGRFAVVADGPATSRPIKLLGVDSIVALFPTLEEALADVAAMQ